MLRKILLHYIAIPLLIVQSTIAQNLEVLGEYKIGIVGQDFEDAIYQATHLGAQEAARDLSRRYSIDIELIVLTPDLNQGGDQEVSIGQLFIGDADGFIISPVKGVQNAVAFAQEQNQQIIFFETALENIVPLASIIADEYTSGVLAGRYIAKLLPNKGRAAILMANNPSAAMLERLDGVRTSLGYKRIEKIVRCEPYYSAAIAAICEADRDDVNDYIDGWVFLDDWPLLGIPTLPWEAGRLPCVAIQSSPSAFLYLDKGYVNALVVHPYYKWGYQSVVMMVDKLHKNQLPNLPHTITAPMVVDWQNVESYRKSWKHWFN